MSVCLNEASIFALSQVFLKSTAKLLSFFKIVLFLIQNELPSFFLSFYIDGIHWAYMKKYKRFFNSTVVDKSLFLLEICQYFVQFLANI